MDVIILGNPIDNILKIPLEFVESLFKQGYLFYIMIALIGVFFFIIIKLK